MPDSNDLPEITGYFSTKDVARILGVSKTSVYAYIRRGLLSPVCAADVLLIAETEIKEFQDKRLLNQVAPVTKEIDRAEKPDSRAAQH